MITAKPFLCPKCGEMTNCSARSLSGQTMTYYGVSFTHTCTKCSFRLDEDQWESDAGAGPMTEGYLICPICGKSYIGKLQ